VLSLHRDGRLDRQVILFSLDPENPALKSHLEDDPENVVLTFKDGSIELRRGALAFPIAHVSDVPLTMSGRARFNIQNAMAAVAACYALGVPEETVRAALQTFHSTAGQNPGRMNVFEIGSIRAVLDYGHNAAAMRALDEVISYLQPRPDGRVLRVAYLAGNRLDQDLEAMGAALTNHCDKLWISDMDPRGRETGESCKIIARGAIASGMAADKVVTHIDEWENVREAFAEAKDGDLLILQVLDVKGLITFLREKQAVVA
jgi:cyanophycin synthetase